MVPCGRESRPTISALASGSFDLGRRESAPCAAMCCCTRPSAACMAAAKETKVIPIALCRCATPRRRASMLSTLNFRPAES
eukprot:2138452-Pleurochrysis_carterae.AAC.1